MGICMYIYICRYTYTYKYIRNDYAVYYSRSLPGRLPLLVAAVLVRVWFACVGTYLVHH